MPDKSNALHLWDDDFLMVELLPKENLEFVKQETRRIGDFSDKHVVVNGFSDVRVISEKPLYTLDKQILIDKASLIFEEAGLSRVQQIIMQGKGLLPKDKTPIVFGTHQFGIVLENHSNFLEHIWISGSVREETDKEKLKLAILKFAHEFGFMAVDWLQCEYSQLLDESDVDRFISSSCFISQTQEP